METNEKTNSGELEKMIELETWRQLELEQQKVEMRQRLKDFISKDQKSFIELMCEATIDMHREDGNPFCIRKDTPGVSQSWYEVIERGNAYLSDMAQLVLSKVRGIEPIINDDGFIPLLDIVADNFSASEFVDSDEISRECDFLSIQHTLFNKYADNLASAMDSACRYVFEGVPIYRKIGEGRGYEIVGFDEPLYLYIYKKGEYFESGPTLHVPDWLKGLYVKDSDVETHNAFFSGEMGLEDAERDMRRRALRNEIGISRPIGNAKEGPAHQTHKTTLLDATRVVIDRYYGSQFNESDLSTITSQKVVVDWLMETYKLSRREAEAVDIVTRPDSARRR
jgi:hypothetical protein